MNFCAIFRPKEKLEALQALKALGAHIPFVEMFVTLGSPKKSWISFSKPKYPTLQYSISVMEISIIRCFC